MLLEMLAKASQWAGTKGGGGGAGTRPWPPRTGGSCAAHRDERGCWRGVSEEDAKPTLRPVVEPAGYGYEWTGNHFPPSCQSLAEGQRRFPGPALWRAPLLASNPGWSVLGFLRALAQPGATREGKGLRTRMLVS